jgi:hypothetical protein
MEIPFLKNSLRSNYQLSHPKNLNQILQFLCLFYAWTTEKCMAIGCCGRGAIRLPSCGANA